MVEDTKVPNAMGRIRKSRNRKPEPVVVEVPVQDVEVAPDEEMTYSDDNAPDTGPIEPIEEPRTMSTDTDTAQKPNFALLIESAPEDYKPERAAAGRKREPSPFDEVLPGLKGQGFKRVPHGGDVTLDASGKVVDKGDTVNEIVRQLQKAQHFHKLGMDLNITPEYVEFSVRDLQKREKKEASANGQTALDANAEQNGDSDSDDRDE